MRFTNPQFVQRTAWLTALVLLAGLAGCQSVAGIRPVSQVRVIDVSPDAPALDIYQNSTQSSSAVLYNVGFGTVSSYIPVLAGANTHAACIAGMRAGAFLRYRANVLVYRNFAVDAEAAAVVGTGGDQMRFAAESGAPLRRSGLGAAGSVFGSRRAVSFSI